MFAGHGRQDFEKGTRAEQFLFGSYHYQNKRYILHCRAGQAIRVLRKTLPTCRSCLDLNFAHDRSKAVCEIHIYNNIKGLFKF
jgi:hypothetical protein